MNRTWSTLLVFLFFYGVGAFYVFRGRKSLQTRTESTFWGVVRIVLGVLLALLSVPFIYYWRRSG